MIPLHSCFIRLVLIMKKKNIVVENKIISISLDNNNNDFISLTDMAKLKPYDSGIVIANWLTTKYTVQFMGAWEKLNNPNFNLIGFHKIKNEVGSNGYIVSSSMKVSTQFISNKICHK